MSVSVFVCFTRMHSFYEYIFATWNGETNTWLWHCMCMQMSCIIYLLLFVFCIAGRATTSITLTSVETFNEQLIQEDHIEKKKTKRIVKICSLFTFLLDAVADYDASDGQLQWPDENVVNIKWYFFDLIVDNIMCNKFNWNWIEMFFYRKHDSGIQ